MIRFYLTPFSQGYAAKLPNAYASKLALYRRPVTHINSWGAVKGLPAKNWCLAWADADDAGHATVQADPDIILIPFLDAAGNYLPVTAFVNEIAPTHRNNISNWLETRRIPTDWITGTMRIGQVLRRLIKNMYIIHQLKEDYPEYDLTATVGSIPAAKRNRILNWMTANNISRDGITTASTVRQVLNRIVEQYQGVAPPKQFGGIDLDNG